MFSSSLLFEALCLLYFFLGSQADETKDESRPYEFSFNVVDFQHRYEKRDENGIVTGEYGFITADGVYHETGYATDKNGDFIITKMRNRKITSLKDAQEIFKDRPEAAKKLVEAVAKACAGCKIPIKENELETTTTIVPALAKPVLQKKPDPIAKEMMRTLMENKIAKNQAAEKKNTIPPNEKNLSNDRRGKDLKAEEIMKHMVDSARKLLQRQEPNNSNEGNPLVNESFLEKMANEIYYRFNYTITSHGHQEDGYRSGKKDGSYRAQSENGVDTQVKYLSNEFGHQPNISFVPRTNSTGEDPTLKGYSFLWYWP